MLPKFIDYGHKCPQCDSNLHLYMRWIGSMLFKGEKIDDNSYRFNVEITGTSHEHFKDEYMTVTMNGEELITEFSSNELKNEAKKWQIYFFMICNPKGLKKTQYAEYKVSLYSACYHKSTPRFEFKLVDEDAKEWALQLTDSDTKELVPRHEDWCFYSHTPELSKVYMIAMHYDKKETEIWHYTVTPEEAQTKGWKPKMFTKKLPLLPHRPAISKADWPKMVDRFESWILMS